MEFIYDFYNNIPLKSTRYKQLNVFIVLLGFLALATTAFVQDWWLLAFQLLAIGCLMLGAYRFSLHRLDKSALHNKDTHENEV